MGTLWSIQTVWIDILSDSHYSK